MLSRSQDKAWVSWSGPKHMRITVHTHTNSHKCSMAIHQPSPPASHLLPHQMQSPNSFMFVLQQGVINSSIYKSCTAIYTHCLIKVGRSNWSEYPFMGWRSNCSPSTPWLIAVFASSSLVFSFLNVYINIGPSCLVKDVLSITSLHFAKVKTKYSHAYVMWTQSRHIDMFQASTFGAINISQSLLN